MREDAFRAFLTPMLAPASVESYIDYVRRVERDLGIDLDRASLDDTGLDKLRDALDRKGLPSKSVGNCLSALRRYAQMRDDGR